MRNQSYVIIKALGKDTSTIYGFNYRITEMQGVVGKEQLKS